MKTFRIHSPSFWIGFHGSLALLNLALLDHSWWNVGAFALSSLCVYGNWRLAQKESA